MMDSNSLEVITRFRDTVFAKRQQLAKAGGAASAPTFARNELASTTEVLPFSNRGIKLLSQHPSLDVLKTKIVEYKGEPYSVLTNETIERNNRRSKRKWSDYYGKKADYGDKEENVWLDEDNDDDGDNDDDRGEGRIHPLKTARIVELLSPLNHPLELVTHPAISKTYKLQTLSKLAMELIDLIEIEQNNLNWLNKLLQVLNGEDWFYLLEENLGLKDYDHGLNDDKKSSTSEERIGEDKEEKNLEQGQKKDALSADVTITAEENNNNEYDDDDENSADPFFALPTAVKRFEAFHELLEPKDDDGGIKEELINYLQVSIQRQHEYIENLTQLRNGLVRADRLKNDLHKWGQEMNDRKS